MSEVYLSPEELRGPRENVYNLLASLYDDSSKFLKELKSMEKVVQEIDWSIYKFRYDKFLEKYKLSTTSLVEEVSGRRGEINNDLKNNLPAKRLTEKEKLILQGGEDAIKKLTESIEGFKNIVDAFNEARLEVLAYTQFLEVVQEVRKEKKYREEIKQFKTVNELSTLVFVRTPKLLSQISTLNPELAELGYGRVGREFVDVVDPKETLNCLKSLYWDIEEDKPVDVVQERWKVIKEMMRRYPYAFEF